MPVMINHRRARRTGNWSAASLPQSPFIPKKRQAHSQLHHRRLRALDKIAHNTIWRIT